MFTTTEFKAAVSEEIRVLRHLATKVDPDQLDWRPSEGQRSTIELMRYLAMCGIGPARAILDDDWSGIAASQERVAAMGADGFDAALAAQERDLHALFDTLSDEDLTTREVGLPWGTRVNLGEALYQTTLRFLIAYRLQLFTHIKTSGRADLGTYESWLGMDKPVTTEV